MAAGCIEARGIWQFRLHLPAAERPAEIPVRRLPCRCLALGIAESYLSIARSLPACRAICLDQFGIGIRYDQRIALLAGETGGLRSARRHDHRRFHLGPIV